MHAHSANQKQVNNKELMKDVIIFYCHFKSIYNVGVDLTT